MSEVREVQGKMAGTLPGGAKNMPMRRRDRQMPLEDAKKLLMRAPFVFLSTAGDDGNPYCVPINMIMTDKETAYIHGMKVGRKIDNIKANPNVCISYAESEGTVPSTKTREGFVLSFRSVVAFGTASLVEDIDEKKMALTKLCEQHLSKELEAYDHIAASVERSAGVTTIYKIQIESICGKQCPN
jgi:nitroimidazol reductase NimA-like FMN-containing flavoprotein (pyridoxamine 5'-phosphate oxidase superfamily)